MVLIVRLHVVIWVFIQNSQNLNNSTANTANTISSNRISGLIIFKIYTHK